MKPLRCLAFFLWLVAIPAVAAEIFVDAKSVGKSEMDGTAERPWATLEEGLAHLSPGDVLSLRPGFYRQEQVRVMIDRVTVRKDPAISGTVIIDGGVPLRELQNQDTKGRQKTENNGPLFRPVVQVNGKGVVLENLEIRNGYLGVSMAGEQGTVRGCHVHHVGQHGIEIMNHRGRVEDCLVHDANLYNVNGQCLQDGKEPGKERANQNARKTINSTDPNRHGKNMDWGQGITFHGKYRGVWAPRGCVLRGNLVWNIWGEGIATFHASDVLMEDNVALNVWRIAYYVQNADQVKLSGNLALYTSDFRTRLGDGAMAVCYSYANEYPAGLLRIAGNASAPLVPDGSDLLLAGNTSWRGDYALHSGDRHAIGTQGGVVVRENMFLLPAYEACINLNNSLVGPLRIQDNLLGRSGYDASNSGQFLALAGERREGVQGNCFVSLGSDDRDFLQGVDDSTLALLARAQKGGARSWHDLRTRIELLRRQFADWARCHKGLPLPVPPQRDQGRHSSEIRNGQNPGERGTCETPPSDSNSAPLI